MPQSVEQQLANRYKEFFAIFVKNKDKISRVTLWGLQDGMSWKNDYPIPNRTNYPLLYNRNFEPKLARQAVLETVK
ncbi:endo-1,4-beta-xylanase [Flavobacterium ovatum]|uniref:endo-1,4-beta-xylanase n=1 Tax=Flavobacterium ovatum TaxID=1928857 RepID=UPI00344B0CD4